KDARIFKYYAKFNNESDFQAGDYALTQAMTFDELIESLKTGKVYREPVFTMTIPEGLTLDQIAAIVEKRTTHSADDFLKLVNDPVFIDEMINKYPTLLTDEVKSENVRYALEGYLYPSTYSYYEDNPSLESIVDQMLSQTATVVAPYTDVLAEKEKSVHWLLTFASLLEEEATASTDREMIASVFFNRIEEHMPLQTDPSVLYAFKGDRTNIASDKNRENPYNTYSIQGLPPGPIANPGQASIDAVLNAPDSNNYFFLADENGTNYFSETYAEHLQKIEEHLR
ncbi:MAG: endolytic transglycosylase MltG, partial [Melioribacteraceae bacterium]|nr:endolytic transglycosylase MltG [Melioribacteraceae bacterium]